MQDSLEYTCTFFAPIKLFKNKQNLKQIQKIYSMVEISEKHYLTLQKLKVPFT